MKSWYLAPRLGAMYRFGEKAVARAGYGRTINPLPWSRPMRGSFPQDIFYNRTADQFTKLGTLEAGIPPVPVPDISSGRVPLPRGVFMRSPNPNDVDRGIIQQWNVAYEYRLPWDIAAEVAYVGTATDGGYADLDLNYGTPGGGNASRQYFALAGTTAFSDWASRTKSRYHGLQLSVNRPLRGNLLLKGRLHLQQVEEHGRRGRLGGADLELAAHVRAQFRDGRLRSPARLPDGRRLHAAVHAGAHGVAARLAQGWQMNGIVSAYSGTPFTVTATNTALNCPACGSITVNYTGDASPTGEAGINGQPFYTLANFSQPTTADVAGFGSDRPQLLPPAGRLERRHVGVQGRPGRPWRPEFRLEMANVFNHTTWGRPVVTVTANNFMQFVPQSTVITDTNNQMNTPGPRRIQVGLRTSF